jgi:hypothetical protein
MKMLCVAWAVMGLAGCSSNPWSESFRAASDEPPAARDAAGPVAVRVVEMSQVREASEAARKYLDQNCVAPEDVTPDDDVALRRAYFEAFRFREDPARFAYLGHSGFSGKDSVRRDDAALTEAARERGADLVFIASEFVGRDTEYRTTPVWSYSTGSIHWRDRTGRAHSDLVSRSTTTWVPVPVEVDRYSNVALFYRRSGDTP